MSHIKNEDSVVVNAPYYVYAPPYRETSGGIRALYQLCHFLNENGQEAYVIYDASEIGLNTPLLTNEILQKHNQEEREPIVIYPEVINGNPMKARHIVRYLLNIPGLLSNTPLDKLGWGSTDLIYTHGKDILPDGWSAPTLQVPLIDTKLFNTNNVGVRRGALVWLHRYLKKGGVPEAWLDDATEISFRGTLRSQAELAELYRKSELFYTYEHTTACFEALLCGCPVVYLPNPLTLEKPVHGYLGDDGVAWGNSKEAIEHAKETVYKVTEYYDSSRREFILELDRFIEDTQSRVKKSSDKIPVIFGQVDGLIRTTRILPGKNNNAVGVPDPEKRIHVGVLSEDIIDGACMRLRIHDSFSILNPWIDAVYFPGRTHYGSKPQSIDIDHFVEWADLILVQRSALRSRNLCYLDKIFSSCKPLIFEVDDWLPGMPASHRQFFDFDPYNMLAFWREKLHLFDAITVSTQPLVEKFSKFNANVHLIPNALSKVRYNNVRRVAVNKNNPITIAFAGTSTHTDDMKVVGQALLNIQRKYGPHLIRFVFWGAWVVGMEGAENVRIVNKSVPYVDYLDELSRLNIDIAIAPLEDNNFNESKSDLKWLEYTAVGAACVLSNVSAYQEAKYYGLAEVVDNDTESWESAISRLIDDEELRLSHKQRSFEYLETFATLETQVFHWIELFKKILPHSRLDTLNSFDKKRLLSLPNKSVQLVSQDVYEKWSDWTAGHKLREIDAEMMAERMVLNWPSHPRFLIIMPVRQSESDLLSHTIDSLKLQLYKNWKFIVIADWDMPDPIFSNNDILGWLRLDRLDDPELYTHSLNVLLADVGFDWVMLLPVGAVLEPQLMLRIGDQISSTPDAQAIYSDHDFYTLPECKVQPSLKPDFSLDYFRNQDYIGPAIAFSYQGIARIGGFEVFPQCEVWNHILRLVENFGLNCVAHIDEILFHFSALPSGQRYFAEASRQVSLEKHLERLEIPALVERGYGENTLRVNYKVIGSPLVSIIIPSRDKLEFLRPCIDSLFEVTNYKNFEIIIVDNDSNDPDVLEYYEYLISDRAENVRVIKYPGNFNFSAQCNLGVSNANGEFILLLNNDTEIIHAEWLERLLAIAQRPEVGAVGARLVYPETGTIQHAGIILGLPGGMLSVADHVFEKSAIDELGYMNRLATDQNYSAVTAACLLVSRDKYHAVGGFDSIELRVLFNDVDFCLKLQQQGLLNVYTPNVTLVHHHAISIGKLTYKPIIALQAAVREQQELETMLRRWLPQLAHDPAYNRHLSIRSRTMSFDPYRGVNWLPRQAGRTKVLGLPLPGGSGEYRVSLPFHALQQAGTVDVSMISPVSGKVELLSVAELARLNPDVLLMHGMLDDASQHAVQQYRKFIPDLRLVFGLDDLVNAIPEKSNVHRIWRKSMPDARPRLRSILAHFDSLIVSTQPLADACKGMIDDIQVVPNRVPRYLWGDVQSQRRQGKKPRVGWVGAQQHKGDLELIIDVVKQTAAEVEWVFMGMCIPELRPYIAEEHRGVAFMSYPEKMASLNLDLAIAPLELNAFNESKSNLRLLEYGVMGWPVICTDIYPYQTNGAPVCRLPNETKAWVKAIRERIYDLDAAYQEGDALRAWVDREYWLEDHLADWHQALLGNGNKNI